MDERPRPALEELLAHTRWVEDLARRLVRDPAAASDLAQSAFVVALREPDRPRTQLRGWLGTVVRNLARERHRRESQRGAVERRGARPEALPSALELLARAEAERSLVQTVTELDEPHRTTLLLHYFEGLSAAEIARLEGVALASITHRITRAHARLRERLGARAGGAGWLAALAPILRHDAMPVPATFAPPPDLPRPFFRHARPLMATATKLLVPVLLVAGIGAYWFLTQDAPSAVDPVVALASWAPTTELADDDAKSAEALRTPAQSATEPEPPKAVVADPMPAPAAATTTTGGRIHGRVLRPDQSPAAGRRVRMIHMAPADGSGTKEFPVICDEDGRFDQRDLGAGTWCVSTFPDKGELELLAIPAEGSLGGIAFLAERTFDLPERGTMEVELGIPPKNPIHVRGRVLQGGQPVKTAAVQWLPVGAGIYDRQKVGRILPDGRYDVTLESPGAYYVSAIIDGARPEWRIDVADERELALDFVLETNVVEGRVVDDTDRPVAKATVELSVRGGRRAPLLMTSISLSTTTDAEGRFRFGSLPDASYVVRAYGGDLGDAKGAGGAFASNAVRAQPLGVSKPVVLTLAPGVRVPVRTIDAKGTERTANVFVFDADGEPLNPATGQAIGKAGARTTIPLAPGRYTVVAAYGSAWSAPVAFEIVRDETPAALELRVEPAAQVEIDATAIPGTLVEARDDDGRRYGSLFDRLRFNRAVERGWDSEVPMLRLPPGNYTLAACGRDGVLASVRVALTAGENPKVRLRP